MQIDDIKIEILTRIESLRYSGQQITFQQQETTEIKNHIRTAYATFHKYRQEMTSRTDQDSDLSFENHNDEETDAAEIEEEDWIEHMKGAPMKVRKRCKIRR